jgi:RNA polymerase sigma-70 factor (ECF subfamily)
MPNPAIQQLFSKGRERWPAISLELAQFCAFAEPRLQERGGEGHATDLYLACACALGNPKALEAFNRELLADLGRWFVGLRLDATTVEDVRQDVLRHLFMPSGSGAPAKIHTYRGESELRTWVRTMAVRAALRTFRGKGRSLGDHTLGQMPALTDNPELRHLKGLYQSKFKEAFAEAVQTLSPRERNLLRQHFLHELTFGQLSVLYKVDRATAVRWLGRARKELARQTRLRLMARLGLGESEMGSVMRLVLSRLDMSLRGLTDPPKGP